MRTIIYLFLAICILQSSNSAQIARDSILTYPPAPDTFKVCFETTKGNVIVEAYRSWAPLAADRFYYLVSSNYYDSIVIFRVVTNFVSQFGLSNDSSLNDYLKTHPIPDEQPSASNKRGTLSFARAGANTRSNQIFINLKDNGFLDKMNFGGAIGFPAFGKVIDGMKAVDSFYAGYGESPSQMQPEIAAGGLRFTREMFPLLDVILKAYIVK